MKPKPFWVLNHLTVPVGMPSPFRKHRFDHRRRRRLSNPRIRKQKLTAARKVPSREAESCGRLLDPFDVRRLGEKYKEARPTSSESGTMMVKSPPGSI